jgi:type III secretion protein D
MNSDSKTSDIVTCLHVSSGLHAGSTVVMGDKSAIVGGDTEADVVLLDEGIAAQHVRIEQKDSLLIVQALAPGVAVNGEALAVDTICDAYFPILLDIGPVSIRIVGPPPPPPAIIHKFNDVTPKALRRPMASHAVIFLMALTGAGLIGYPFSGWLGGSNLSRPDKPIQQASAMAGSKPNIAQPFEGVPLLTPVAPPALKPEVAADTMRKSIVTAGLQSLAVSVADGHIAVSGTLTPDEQTNWQKIQKNFDEQNTGQILLIDNVSVAAAPPAPRLGFEAVSLGKDPYVVVAGRRHKTGSVIDGWEIKAIERNRITIRRGTQTISLTY